MSNLIYGIQDKPKTFKEWIGYTMQFVFSVLTATILISVITGTNVAAGMVSAGLCTIFFLCVTGFKIPVCLSNSGNTVAAVVAALAMSGPIQKNFAGVAVGGLVVAIVYCLAAAGVKKWGSQWLKNLMPPIVSSTLVIIIGATLSFFAVSYAQINGQYSLLGVGIAFFVALLTAAIAHYGKGIVKRLPFLLGLLGGYILCIILTLCGVPGLVNVEALHFDSLFSIPDFAFLHLNFTTFDWSYLPQIILVWTLYAISGLGEHISDITATSTIVGEDFIGKSLHKTLVGDGVGSALGTIIAGPTNCTYSEYCSTIAVSKVASTAVTFTTALTLILFGFLTPFNVILSSISNVCFAGTSFCAYGAIAFAGLRNLINSNIDWNDNKNLMIFAIMITVGISGIAINYGALNLAGIPLAMLTGIILNVILKNKNSK